MADTESRRIARDLAGGRNAEELGSMSAEDIVEHVRRELDSAGSELSRRDVAAALVELGDQRANSDRPNEAAAAAKMAVELYRALAVNDPETYREEFAVALDGLARRMAAVWLHEPALQANREARRVRRGAPIQG
ncbi:MAG: hypothetical protein OXC94_05760 [Chloroflexi bacterium]|nr:hypothetical protein [Chloroflexota bacterium]